MRRPPPPRPPEDRGETPIQTPPPATRPAASALPDSSAVSVVFSGGYETDPRDRGRPVVLVAAGLNVPSEVFRKAFSNVKPASAGEAPDPVQVRLNKQALLQDLEPYGVTNDRLDTVSNYYRYNRSRGEMWRNKPASAYATVKNGIVTSITITDAGSGYSSVPEITVPAAEGQHLSASVLYSTDLSKNGSIEKITIDQSIAADRVVK